MKLSSQDKKELSRIRFDKALEFLSDAQANFEGARYKTSINRSYYACLNAVRSLLILEGANPESPPLVFGLPYLTIHNSIQKASYNLCRT